MVIISITGHLILNTTIRHFQTPTLLIKNDLNESSCELCNKMTRSLLTISRLSQAHRMSIRMGEEKLRM